MLASSSKLPTWNFQFNIEQLVWPCALFSICTFVCENMMSGIQQNEIPYGHQRYFNANVSRCNANWVFTIADNLPIQTNRHCATAGMCALFFSLFRSLTHPQIILISYVLYMENSPILHPSCSLQLLLFIKKQFASFVIRFIMRLYRTCTRKIWTGKLSNWHTSVARADCHICICRA